MYALRYATVPVVRLTGGLADTVTPFDGTNLDDADGFGFINPAASDFYVATWLAITLVYVTLSILAARASAWGVAAALGAVVLVLALRTVYECGAATAAVLRALEPERAARDEASPRTDEVYRPTQTETLTPSHPVRALKEPGIPFSRASKAERWS